MVEFKKRIPYDLSISATLTGGLMVRVGCAEMFYMDTNSLLADLREYLDDPDKVILAYNEAVAAYPRNIEVPDQPTLTGDHREPVHPVAFCHCGAGLDAMGRCVTRMSGGGPTPRGAERLGRSPR